MPRLAASGEETALRDLVRAAYAHYVPRLGREPAPMTDDYAARIAAGQAWVEEADGVPVAVLVLEDHEDSLLIDNIAVAEAARGLGLGRALMDFAEAEARRRHHRRIYLYTNEKMVENIAIYTRLGYAETHRAEQGGHRRVFMEKHL
ncbi:GNAT family N-acetyltransferase [Roseococcus pinisoli]|uniref:GNAT family N-acetyltransferase n=1 Tax=Roseococcus pinisoli TaxID=2835040 RepID=A0ABS5QFV3_9PROT|nr:GNAT family N-acetyltransferase [Roseococcus pinisoli]MBS7812258.1 GNAT family N-acetyltransferase [Roseococcus pinisoli]